MPSDLPPPEPGSDRGSENEPSAAQPVNGAEPVERVEAAKRPERQAPPKRPRYLAVALVGALVLGAGCWTEGCDRMRLYKTPAFYAGEPEPGQALNASVKSPEGRQRAEVLYQHFIEAAEQARKRAFPMAAATWVLGAALLALASRGLAGKTNTRHALVQVVIAQAAVVVATYFVAPDLRNAELDWEQELALIHQQETLSPEQYQRAVPMMQNARRFGVPGWLVVRSFVSVLIVFALTRPRSRAFFEAAGNTVSEG